MNKYRAIGRLALPATLGLALAGCGTGGPAGRTPDTPSDAPAAITTDWVQSELMAADWDDKVIKSADCQEVDVQTAGSGTYRCSVGFLAITDTWPYLVEVRSDGVWSAQPDLS